MSELQLTKDEYHLYVLELVGFGVKVGISKNPRRRLATLRKHAEDHGTPVGRTFISHPHVEARANERHLITLGGSGNRREYLPGIGYDAAVSATVGLPMHRAGSEVRDREEAERNRVSFFWPAGTTHADIHRMAAAVFGVSEEAAE
ncbi:hypothetical protein PBI_MOZY_56 [Mycobacterium phage Mozy]|uniref:Uncharacterized protein n=1 Tax=Mycobacterium phage Mozy TaxID=2922213 RepID=G1D4H0_9CAUD|nr:hypothetical protein FGG28_gp056 [Mycobacterium phage Mozy]AEK09670.1 hypothetical protein PBI_MOZY_56 [Mycobacterium phage Mozy]